MNHRHLEPSRWLSCNFRGANMPLRTLRIGVFGRGFPLRYLLFLQISDRYQEGKNPKGFSAGFSPVGPYDPSPCRLGILVQPLRSIVIYFQVEREIDIMDFVLVQETTKKTGRKYSSSTHRLHFQRHGAMVA
jgi:hypothetical protein